MSEEKEQDKEKISASLHGNSINATNVTIIHSPTIDQSSPVQQTSNINSNNNESTNSSKTKQYILVGAIITALGSIIGGFGNGIYKDILNLFGKDSATVKSNVREPPLPLPIIIAKRIPENTKNSPLQNKKYQITQPLSAFFAGTYYNKSANKYFIFKVTGPSHLRTREAWSVTTADGSFSAQWYTGGKDEHPSLASYRYSYKLEDGPSYGRVGTVDPKALDSHFENWEKGRVVSVQQTRNGLTITQYTNGRPGETLTLTLQE